jgi:hypothetical protein
MSIHHIYFISGEVIIETNHKSRSRYRLRSSSYEMGNLHLHRSWNNVMWILLVQTLILFSPYNPQCVMEWERWLAELIDLMCNIVVCSCFLYFGFHLVLLLPLSLLSLVLIPTVVEEFGISGYNSLRFLWRDVIFQGPMLEAEAEGEERETARLQSSTSTELRKSNTGILPPWILY